MANGAGVRAESQIPARSPPIALRLVRWPRRRRLLPLLHVLHLRAMALDQLLRLLLVTLFYLLLPCVIGSLLLELLVVFFLSLLQLLLLLGLLGRQFLLLLLVLLIPPGISCAWRIQLFARLNFPRMSRVRMSCAVVSRAAISAVDGAPLARRDDAVSFETIRSFRRRDRRFPVICVRTKLGI